MPGRHTANATRSGTTGWSAPGPCPHAQSCGASRSYRLLGLRHHRGLELPHNDSSQRGFLRPTLEPRLPYRRGSVGSRERRGCGERCKAYGVGGLLRLPGRLHITWSDDQTLRLDADAGTQSRILSFRTVDNSQAGTWQGVSIASWDRGVSPMGTGLGPPPAAVRLEFGAVDSGDVCGGGV